MQANKTNVGGLPPAKPKKDKGEPVDWVLQRNKFGVYQWKPVYRQYNQLKLSIW